MVPATRIQIVDRERPGGCRSGADRGGRRGRDKAPSGVATSLTKGSNATTALPSDSACVLTPPFARSFSRPQVAKKPSRPPSETGPSTPQRQSAERPRVRFAASTTLNVSKKKEETNAVATLPRAARIEPSLPTDPSDGTGGRPAAPKEERSPARRERDAPGAAVSTRPNVSVANAFVSEVASGVRAPSGLSGPDPVDSTDAPSRKVLSKSPETPHPPRPVYKPPLLPYPIEPLHPRRRSVPFSHHPPPPDPALAHPRECRAGATAPLSARERDEAVRMREELSKLKSDAAAAAARHEILERRRGEEIASLREALQAVTRGAGEANGDLSSTVGELSLDRYTAHLQQGDRGSCLEPFTSGATSASIKQASVPCSGSGSDEQASSVAEAADPKAATARKLAASHEIAGAPPRSQNKTPPPAQPRPRSAGRPVVAFGRTLPKELEYESLRSPLGSADKPSPVCPTQASGATAVARTRRDLGRRSLRGALSSTAAPATSIVKPRPGTAIPRSARADAKAREEARVARLLKLAGKIARGGSMLYDRLVGDGESGPTRAGQKGEGKATAAPARAEENKLPFRCGVAPPTQPTSQSESRRLAPTTVRDHRAHTFESIVVAGAHMPVHSAEEMRAIRMGATGTERAGAGRADADDDGMLAVRPSTTGRQQCVDRSASAVSTRSNLGPAEDEDVFAECADPDKFDLEGPQAIATQPLALGGTCVHVFPVCSPLDGSNKLPSGQEDDDAACAIRNDQLALGSARSDVRSAGPSLPQRDEGSDAPAAGRIGPSDGVLVRRRADPDSNARPRSQAQQHPPWRRPLSNYKFGGDRTTVGRPVAARQSPQRRQQHPQASQDQAPASVVDAAASPDDFVAAERALPESDRQPAARSDALHPHAGNGASPHSCVMCGKCGRCETCGRCAACVAACPSGCSGPEDRCRGSCGGRSPLDDATAALRTAASAGVFSMRLPLSSAIASTVVRPTSAAFLKAPPLAPTTPPPMALRSASGCTALRWRDGRTLATFPNGDIRRVLPSEGVLEHYEARSGAWTVRYLGSGTEVTYAADGATTLSLAGRPCEGITKSGLGWRVPGVGVSEKEKEKATQGADLARVECKPVSSQAPSRTSATLALSLPSWVPSAAVRVSVSELRRETRRPRPSVGAWV